MNRAGFTLIEIVIVIVVMGIVGFFSFNFFASLSSTYVTLKGQRLRSHEGAYIMERISRELRGATAINTCSGGASLVFTLPSPGTPADSSTTVTYSLSGSQLIRNSILLGGNITTFTATASGTNCCVVDLVWGDASWARREYVSTVCPRNLSSLYNGDYSDTY